MKVKGNVVDPSFFSLLDDVFENTPAPAIAVPVAGDVDTVPDVARIVRRRTRGVGESGVVRRVTPRPTAAQFTRESSAEGAIKSVPSRVPSGALPPVRTASVEVAAQAPAVVVKEVVPELTAHEKLLATIDQLSPRALMGIANLDREDGVERVREQLREFAEAHEEEALKGCVGRWRQQRYESLSEEEHNFRYKRNDNLAPSGRVSRIRANMAAIALLKELEREDRLASDQEKAVLAAYAGWGADKEVFNTSRSAFREYKSRFRYSDDQMQSYYPEYGSWEKEYGRFYDELKRDLTDDEWNAAAHSTLNAHYTSEEVCHSLWDIAVRAGFSGGNVLEPAMGNGAIIGAMPMDLQGKAFVTGVELDSISARLAKKLYPEGRVFEGAFEEAKQVYPNSQDLVITNVPFSDVGPGVQNGAVEFNLHNFFIAESLKKLKPGGLLIAITSASTMENNPAQLEELASRSELVGAIRLPSNAFAKRANTSVVTDILVLRKPLSEKIGSETWSQSLPVVLDEDTRAESAKGEAGKLTLVNEYFVRHPEMVLGRHSMKGKMYGANEAGQYTVEAVDGVDMAEALNEAIDQLPEGILTERRGETAAAELVAEELGTVEKIYGSLSDKIGNYVIADGRVHVVSSNELELVAPPWRRDDEGAVPFKMPRGFNPERADELTADFVDLREDLKKQIAIDLNPVATDSESARQRSQLKTRYEGFTAKWGDLNSSPAVDRILSNDPEWGAVLALENVRREFREGKAVDIAVPSTILTERTLHPIQRPSKAGSINEAILISLSETGFVELPYVARLIGSEDLDGVETMILKTGLAFRDPQSGILESKERYLSGNVVKKLEAAEAAAQLDGDRYRANVEALQPIQPRQLIFGEISAELGAPWIPTEVLSRFAFDRLGQSPQFRPAYLKEMDKWIMPSNYQSSPKFHEFSTPKKSAIDILEAAMNNQRIRIYAKVSETESVYDEKASNLANDRVTALRESFASFLKEDTKCQEMIEEAFNSKFNHSIVPVYDGSYLMFPGLSTAMTPRKAQCDVTARCLQEQCGIVAHDVGYGKTLSAIMMAFESKRMGLAQKPLIACDNSNYAQFAATIREVYPQANILVSDEDSMSAKKRTAFLSRVATGNWDMVVMAHSHIDRIPNSNESMIKFHAESISELRAALSAVDRAGGEKKSSKRLTRQIEKAIERETEKLKNLRERMEKNQDDCLAFQELGIDLLFVDEIHKYKKLPFATSMGNVKGLDTGRSQRGTSMLIKAQSIQERRNGKGVIGLTATPVTNTMAECWNMIRLTDPNKLREYSVERFDQYANTFCRQITKLELNESNGKWREVTRLAKFVNGPTFIQFVRGSMDVKNDPNEANLVLPKIKGGGPQLLTVDLTDEVADIMDDIADIYSAYENYPGDKREVSFVPIMLMQVGMAGSIDPRLVNAAATDDPDSLVNTVVRGILSKREETDGKTQVVFCDRYRTMDTSILDALRTGGISQASRLVEIEDADSTSENEEEGAEAVEEAVAKKGGSFNLYHDVRDKLIAGGYPADKVLIPGEAKTGDERAAMFARANSERDIVIIGSTTKIGVGCNFQERLAVMWHLDPPRTMTPADLTQRNGRGVRQGNTCEEIENYYCGMKDTVMPGIYDRISTKGAFVSQAMAGRGVGVEFEDAGSLDLDQMKAGLISDKRVLEQAELRIGIKESKSQLEIVMSRRSNLASDLNWRERYLGQLDEKLPKAVETAEAFRSTVVPPMTSGEVKFSAPDGTQFEGGYKEVVKELSNIVDAWKKIEFKDLSAVIKKLGRIVVNGMNVDVTKEIVSVADSKTAIIGKCHHEATGYIGKEFTFTTPEAILRMVQSRFEEIVEQPVEMEREREKVVEGISSIQGQIAKCGDGDEVRARVQDLSKRLVELEEKMRTEPYVRRSKRAAAIEAETSAVIVPMETEDPDEDEVEIVEMRAAI